MLAKRFGQFYSSLVPYLIVGEVQRGDHAFALLQGIGQLQHNFVAAFSVQIEEQMFKQESYKPFKHMLLSFTAMHLGGGGQYHLSL